MRTCRSGAPRFSDSWDIERANPVTCRTGAPIALPGAMRTRLIMLAAVILWGCSKSAVHPGARCSCPNSDGSAAGSDGGSHDGASDATGGAGSGGAGGVGGKGGAGNGGTAGTSTINCAAVGCGPPPVCGSACSAPCGCCICADGERQDDLVCRGGCYAAVDGGVLDGAVDDGNAFSSCTPSGATCGAGSACIEGCPSSAKQSIGDVPGICSVPGRDTCGCGVVVDPCVTPGTICLMPACCDYQGICVTPAERAAICARPEGAHFDCSAFDAGF
jgi:hypothetical protein